MMHDFHRPLHFALSYCSDPSIIARLLERGATPSLRASKSMWMWPAYIYISAIGMAVYAQRQADDEADEKNAVRSVLLLLGRDDVDVLVGQA